MFRFVSSLASKVRPSKKSIYHVGIGLSWNRNYASQGLKLGPQESFYLENLREARLGVRDRFCNEGLREDRHFLLLDGQQCLPFLLFDGQQCLAPGVGTSSLQLFDNPSCDVVECGIRYLPVMRKALRFGVLKALEDGADFFKIIRTIRAAVKTVLEHLKCRVQMIVTSEQFSQVAIAAANGDTETSQLVARAFEKVANGRYILCECFSNNVLEFYNAIDLDWKPLSRFMRGKDMRVLQSPKILISENKITNKSVVLRATGMANNKPLLIIAKGLGKEVERILFTLNRSQTKLNVHVVEAPDVEYTKEIMKALAIFTGGQVLTSSSDINFQRSMLGSCKKALVTTDSLTTDDKMIILGGSASQEEIEKRYEQLRSTFDKDVEVDSLKDNLDKLSCSTAVIKVDRSSETKVGNIVDAVVSAYESGVLPGAGVALLHASKELDKFQTKDSDGKIAIQIIQNALKMPVFTMASIAGYDGSFVVKKLLEQDNPNLGYNPVTGEYVDVIKSGIIDPFGCIMKELNNMNGYLMKDVHACMLKQMERRKKSGTELGG